MKKIFISFIALLELNACSHSVSFRGNHFATPTVSQNKWGGNFSFATFNNTSLQLIDNIYSSNPNGTPVPTESAATPLDWIGVNNFGLNAELAPIESLSAYLDGTIMGLKWQFLKPAQPGNGWVAAAQVGFASDNREESTSTTSGNSTSEANASSQINRSQFAVSLGHEFNYIIPYISAVYEDIRTKTSLRNDFGSWSFSGKGKNTFYAVGIYSTERWVLDKVRFGIEYSHITMNWDGGTHRQNSLGATLGASW